MQASKPHLPVGGHLKYFVNEWYKLTSDPNVIDTVKGMHINLDNIPHQKVPPRPLKLSPAEIAAADEQIRTLLKKRAIIPAKKGQKGEFLSTIFLREKKDKGHRTILNLKSFNKNVHYDHFHMETLQHILTLVTKNCFMAIFDLQDAYLVISIAGVHIKFLKFEWKGRVYMYVVMPFGLAEAPKKFTKLLKPILSRLRRLGIVIAIYIDDGWVRGNTFDECLHNVMLAVKLFSKLGFLLHKEKSVPVPSQQVSILGFDIDSVSMLITIGDEKTLNAIKLCREALRKNRITIRFLAKIIGTLISLLPACPWGRAHYRSLEIIKLEALTMNKWNWDAKCSIFGQAVKDLNWWIATLPNTAAPIKRNKLDMTLWTDSSDEGWGAHFGGMYAQGRFDCTQRQYHINTKEVIAVYYGIKVFRPYFTGNHLLLRCDNTTAIADVKSMGSTVSPLRDSFARLCWQELYEKDCWMSVNYIKSSDNFHADLASRWFNDRTEWALLKETFFELAMRFGCPSIDLFASRLNKKLNRYISWIPDPFCVEVDAFFYDWSEEYPFINPPFNLLNRCLDKCQQDEVQKALIVFPLWTTQHWFPQLLDMLISHIFLLPKHPPPPHLPALASRRGMFTTPQPAEFEPSSSNNIHESHDARRIPSHINYFISGGIRFRTQANYRGDCESWLKFCKERERNPYTPSLTDILEFLYYRAEKTKFKAVGPSFFQQTGSALKWVVNASHHPNLEHVYVKHFIQGYFNKNPPPPKPPKTTWDIQHVLDYWSKQPPNNKLDLLTLARKTATLVLLATCRRKTELLSLSVNHMYIFPQCLTFYIVDAPKAYTRSNPREHYRWLTLRQLDKTTDTKLCPVRVMTSYILKTKRIRNSDRVFITNTPPYEAIKPMTLNGWILTTMEKAGVDISQFTPYTTRHASASAALQRGLSLDEVLSLGCWSTPSTFIKHYNLPVIKNITARRPTDDTGPNLQEVITPARYIPSTNMGKRLKTVRANVLKQKARENVWKANSLLKQRIQKERTNTQATAQTEPEIDNTAEEKDDSPRTAETEMEIPAHNEETPQEQIAIIDMTPSPKLTHTSSPEQSDIEVDIVNSPEPERQNDAQLTDEQEMVMAFGSQKDILQINKGEFSLTCGKVNQYETRNLCSQPVDFLTPKQCVLKLKDAMHDLDYPDLPDMRKFKQALEKLKIPFQFNSARGEDRNIPMIDAKGTLWGFTKEVQTLTRPPAYNATNTVVTGKADRWTPGKPPFWGIRAFHDSVGMNTNIIIHPDLPNEQISGKPDIDLSKVTVVKINEANTTTTDKTNKHDQGGKHYFTPSNSKTKTHGTCNHYHTVQWPFGETTLTSSVSRR